MLAFLMKSQNRERSTVASKLRSRSYLRSQRLIGMSRQVDNELNTCVLSL
jgi:hypothetical protein